MVNTDPLVILLLMSAFILIGFCLVVEMISKIIERNEKIKSDIYFKGVHPKR